MKINMVRLCHTTDSGMEALAEALLDICKLNMRLVN